ncbi:MAG: metallophosphoesterase [Planctomycetales bacterium]
MKIRSVQESPFHEVPFRMVEPGGRRISEKMLPIQAADVDALPAGIDALVACADLQGREIDPQRNHLLGHVVAEALESLCEYGVLPPQDRVGILLAGDFYVVPALDKRGGYGDVRRVWESFASRFKWVAGVAGNHDAFGMEPGQEEKFRLSGGVHVLEGESVSVDDLHLAGVGGVIGSSGKPRRRDSQAFRGAVRSLLQRNPGVLILHQGPDDPRGRRDGHAQVREELETSEDLLVVCGHRHWDDPLLSLTDQVQVLNVDMRVVVMTSGWKISDGL